ncbi:MAG: hypothetical protein M1358_18385, partial [Chloroflexi bacterium]|nr:hypothetical protein [Chloroflexota bacterium]
FVRVKGIAMPRWLAPSRTTDERLEDKGNVKRSPTVDAGPERPGSKRSRSLRHAREQHVLSGIDSVLEQARLSDQLEERQVEDHEHSELMTSLLRELLTPIGLIKGYVSLLRMKDVDLDGETVNRYLTVIGEEIEHLTGVVEHLLSLHRTSAETSTSKRKQ